jgi:hypothetical protein
MATVRDILEDVLHRGPLDLDTIALHAGAREADARAVLDRLVSAGALESQHATTWDAPRVPDAENREERVQLAWRNANASNVDLDASV